MTIKRANTSTSRKTLSARRGSATKKDLEDFKKEILHQFHIISEGLIDQIKLLAEGHSGIIQRLDRTDTRLEGVETKLDRVETRLDGVETRLDRVETKLDRVDTRLDGVETRLDHMARENERQHEETRALVKLSFSELDKRISNLESQVKELQEWRKQVEARPRI